MFLCFWLKNPGLKMDEWLGLKNIVIYHIFLCWRKRGKEWDKVEQNTKP